MTLNVSIELEYHYIVFEPMISVLICDTGYTAMVLSRQRCIELRDNYLASGFKLKTAKKPSDC